jgi:serine/threonine-protein phosphatase 2A regulatory subunit B
VREGREVYSFKSGNEHRLHSLTLSPDQENFVTGDEQSICLWNLERHGNPVYNLYERSVKRGCISDEVVTSAKFSQESPVFLFTTSRGQIKICDFRESSSFQDRASMQFALRGRKDGANLFDPWLNVVSDACFVPNSNHVLSRDYLSTKLWDLRMGDNTMIVDSHNTAKPIYSANVTDYLQSHLGDLHETDYRHDEFFLDVSPDGKHVATGSYNKSGHVQDIHATTSTSIVCKFNEQKDQSVGTLKVFDSKKRLISQRSGLTSAASSVDFRKRISLGSWKPQRAGEAPGSNTLALVFRNCIYLY